MIYVRYGKPINIKNQEEVVFIKFDFDRETLGNIKALPLRYWLDNEDKEWEITKQGLKELDKIYSGNILGIREEDKIIKNVGKNIMQEVDLPDNLGLKLELMPHQETFIKKALSVDNVFNASQIGTGKSLMTIGTALARKRRGEIDKCLIICGVSTIKMNWRDIEIPKSCNEKSYILGSRLVTRGERKGKWKKTEDIKNKIEDLYNIDNIDAFFLIVNVESLRNEEFVNKLAELCRNGKIGMVAVDEAQACKNSESEQGSGLLKLEPKYKQYITATPIKNNAMDFYAPLKWCGYEDRTVNEFKKKYCVEINIEKKLPSKWGGYYIKSIPKIVGSKNMPEIQDKLKYFMVRYLKKEVLKDLPPITYQKILVEMTPKQQKVYDIVRGEIKAKKEELLLKCNEQNEIMRLREVTNWTGIVDKNIKESAKMERLIEMTKEIVENGEKVVLFSWFKLATRVMKDLLKNYNVAYIDGDVTEEDRTKEINKFQNDSSCQIMIGTMGSLGVGVTLTSANNVIFLDEGQYDGTTKLQSAERIYRKGQTKPCMVYTLQCADTIDERVGKLIEAKIDFSNAMLDGGKAVMPKDVLMSREEMFDYLIGDSE